MVYPLRNIERYWEERELTRYGSFCRAARLTCMFLSGVAARSSYGGWLGCSEYDMSQLCRCFQRCRSQPEGVIVPLREATAWPPAASGKDAWKSGDGKRSTCVADQSLMMLQRQSQPNLRLVDGLRVVTRFSRADEKWWKKGMRI